MKGELSPRGKKLSEEFLREYVKSGYLYSGSISYRVLLDEGYTKQDIQELLDAAVIAKRDCEEYAFQLTTPIRYSYVKKLGLATNWYQSVGPAMLLDIQEEIRAISPTFLKEQLGSYQRYLAKSCHNPEMEQHDAIEEITTRLRVGQVVMLEYHIPRNRRDKEEGQFLIISLCKNHMFYPPQIVADVQPLSPRFQAAYPTTLNGIAFEEAILRKNPNL